MGALANPRIIRSLDTLTGGLATPTNIDFDLTATLARQSGRLKWNGADGIQTLELGMAGSEATLQIGEEMYYRIKASAAITNGQVVMFSGTVGASGALMGAPATGLTPATSLYVMGIATEDIANNGWGYVTAFGSVGGLNTTGGAEAWADGQILYYDPTVTGGLTKNVPAAPNPKIVMAAVVFAHPVVGSLFVRPSFGGSLGQFEGDVQITAPAAGEVLTWDAGGFWRNKLPAGITPIAGNSYVKMMGPESASHNTVTWTEKANCRIVTAGGYRVTFTLQSATALGSGRVYKNGVALGTIRTNTLVGSPQTWTQDFTFAADDTVQIFLSDSGGTVTLTDPGIGSTAATLTVMPFMTFLGDR